MADHALAGLASTLRGELITRDKEEAFRAARLRGWNGDLNTRAKPLAFVVASGARDIVTTVNFCRSNNIPVTVRGKGAHSPYGMANDEVVIDTMTMTGSVREKDADSGVIAIEIAGKNAWGNHVTGTVRVALPRGEA